MYTKEEKIELVKYLESVTVGSTESVGLEYMTEPQLDALIRFCKVDPASDAQMMRVKNAMDIRNEYRAAMREERLREIRIERYIAANANYDNLSVEYRQMFVEFVKENKETFTQCSIDNFDWLDNPALRPSVDFWTGELGVAVNEIVSRLLFGKDNIADAITAKYTYDGVTNGPICSVMLVDELDGATKRMLFWKYAKARLQYI
jgi:hypothetical protein